MPRYRAHTARGDAAAALTVAAVALPAAMAYAEVAGVSPVNGARGRRGCLEDERLQPA
jgi:MFS superfamily sulfate permease-like transporter